MNPLNNATIPHQKAFADIGDNSKFGPITQVRFDVDDLIYFSHSEIMKSTEQRLERVDRTLYYYWIIMSKVR